MIKTKSKATVGAPLLQAQSLMNHQTSDSPQDPTSDASTNPRRLPARVLKVIVGLILVLALMFWVVRSGAMRAYEQPAQDTQQGDHQSDQGIQGTQNDKGMPTGVNKP